MRTEPDIRPFCRSCKADYENAGDYTLRRTRHIQTKKKACSFCSVRSGYDYEVVPKTRKEGCR